MNKINQSERITSRLSEISASNTSCSPEMNSKVVKMKKLSELNAEVTDTDRENFYHWGEVDGNYAKSKLFSNKNPETRRLVEQRNTLSRSGTKTIWPPLPTDDPRPNKHSRQQIAEIDAELLQRANRLVAATSITNYKRGD